MRGISVVIGSVQVALGNWNIRKSNMSSTDDRGSSELEPGGRLGELRLTARGGLVSLIGNVASSILGFGFVVLVGRTLSIRQAGGLFEAIAIFTMFSYATVLGADWGLIKFMPTVSAHRDRRFLLAIAIGPAFLVCAIIAAVIFIKAGPIARLVIHHGNTHVAERELRILAPFLPLATAMPVALAGIRAWSIKESVFVQSFLVPIGQPLLFGAFLVLGITPLLGAVAFATPLALGAIVALVLLLRHLADPIVGERYTTDAVGMMWTSDQHLFVEFWKFSGPRSVGALFQILLTSIDVLLLGVLGSNKQVAAYTVASRYVFVGLFALFSVGVAIAPQLSRLWNAERKDAVREVYRESTWWIMAISWPVLIIMALFAPLLMSLVGHGYSTGVVALEILAISMLANTGTGNNGIAILMAGGSTTNLVIYASALILNVTLNAVLIPRFESKGAAIAWSVSILFTAFAASFMLFRIARIHPFGSSYVAVATSAIVSYGMVGLSIRIALGATWVSACVVTACGSACYVTLLALFRRKGWLNLREIQTFVTGFRGARRQ